MLKNQYNFDLTERVFIIEVPSSFRYMLKRRPNRANISNFIKIGQCEPTLLFVHLLSQDQKKSKLCGGGIVVRETEQCAVAVSESFFKNEIFCMTLFLNLMYIVQHIIRKHLTRRISIWACITSNQQGKKIIEEKYIFYWRAHLAGVPQGIF